MPSYSKKFIEAEIRTEEHCRTPSPLLKAPRKTRTESGDSLDSLPSSALFKDIVDINKTPHLSTNKFEEATSYDSHFSVNKLVLQEEMDSVKSEELEAEVADKAFERLDTSVLFIEQKSSPQASLKAVVSLSADQLKKKQIGLAVEQNRKEISEERYKDEESAIVKSSYRPGKELLKGDSSLSEQSLIFKELSYSNDFESSNSKKDTLKDRALPTEYCKDDFDTSALSLGQSPGSQGGKLWHTKTSRNKSSSIGSDNEISECLDNKSLSVADGSHSERLLEFKSPTELMKSEEHSDMEKEPAHVDSSLWAPSAKREEGEDGLLDFSIGDRVLVSNVQPGTLRFKGQTSFAKGLWAGVELDKPEGNNNGTYNGITYFDCKEKHGIFAPPQKISQISESFDDYMDIKEDTFCKNKLDHYYHEADQKGSKSYKEDDVDNNANEKLPPDKSQRNTSVSEGSLAGGDYVKITAQINQVATVAATIEEKLAQEQDMIDSLKTSVDDNSILSASISDASREASTVAVEGPLDSIFPEKWKQPSWQEYTEKSDSLASGVLEKPATPLLDLLSKERNQLEAQLRLPSQELEELKDQEEKVGLLTDSLLQAFVKDTVHQLQQIKKVRNEKIQVSNQELCAVQEKKLAAGNLQSILISSELDDGEEVSSPDMCPRPVSTVS